MKKTYKKPELISFDMAEVLTVYSVNGIDDGAGGAANICKDATTSFCQANCGDPCSGTSSCITCASGGCPEE